MRDTHAFFHIPEFLPTIDGGISNSSRVVPFTFIVHRFTPGIPGVPWFPGFPVRPLGPGNPEERQFKKNIRIKKKNGRSLAAKFRCRKEMREERKNKKKRWEKMNHVKREKGKCKLLQVFAVGCSSYP